MRNQTVLLGRAKGGLAEASYGITGEPWTARLCSETEGHFGGERSVVRLESVESAGQGLVLPLLNTPTDQSMWRHRVAG